MNVSAADFKTHCLRYMDWTHSKREEIIITKRGKPVAKLVPLSDPEQPLFGRLRGSATLHGNLIDPVDISWDAL